jgi:hypothetical protein
LRAAHDKLKLQAADSEENMRNAVIEREKALHRAKEMEELLRSFQKEMTVMRDALNTAGE